MQKSPDNVEKVELYLSLGSNQGDKRLNIEVAVSMLNIELKKPYKAVSSLIETEPEGFESEENFLNAAVLYEIELPRGFNAEAAGLMILEICKGIERKMGRTGQPMYDGNGERIYTDRPIDIDILFLGDRRIDSEELSVPHKKMKERDFVMVPLKEIASEQVMNSFKDIFED